MLIRNRALGWTLGLWAGVLAMPTGQAGGAPSDALTAAIACGECEQWNLPHAPVRIHGDTWYVGVDGLSSILIRTGAGLVLLDGDLPQSVPLIEANIRSLGLDVRDVRLILVSHEHFDHVGGVAALQRDSGAKVLGGAAAVRALQAGQPTAEDPQFHSRPNAFPIPAAGMRAVQDGETIAIGGLAITAHRTPGHTPGSTSWTWRSCERGDCREIVYADSLAAISSAGFRYTGDAGRADTTIAFRDSIARIGALPCDILLTPHPSASDFWERVAARSRKSPVDPLVDRQACKEYAARALRGLEERIAEESAAGARKAGAGSR